MIQRITYGLLAITALVATFVFDAVLAHGALGRDGAFWSLVRRGSALPLVILVLFLFGAKELDRMLRLRGARPFSKFAFVMIAVLLLSPWLSAAGFLGSGAAQLEGLYWQIVWLIVSGIGIGVLAVLRGDPEGTLRDVGATSLLVLYIGFLGSFALQLRCGRDIPVQVGGWLLLFVILVTKISDIGAYFTGSFFGRHRLAPSVSPAKSIEGAIGGLVASVGFAIVTVTIIAPSMERSLASHGGPDGLGIRGCLQFLSDPTGMPPIIWIGLLALCVSISGQFGDLFESCFKRDADIKDSGEVFQPFGGILDMLDSPVFAMPVAWVFLVSF